MGVKTPALTFLYWVSCFYPFEISSLDRRNSAKKIGSKLNGTLVLVPFRESRFPLFDTSIQAGKRSSRSITERSCAPGIEFFHKAQASNFQQRRWSPLCNKSAGSECSRKFCKFGMVQHHSLLPKERSWKPWWNPVTFSSKQQKAGWSTSSQAREWRKISPPSSACYRFYTFGVSQM